MTIHINRELNRKQKSLLQKIIIKISPIVQFTTLTRHTTTTVTKHCQQSYHNSLKIGTVRGCSFRVPVRRDVFNYLFCDRGRCVSRKRGKLSQNK